MASAEIVVFISFFTKFYSISAERMKLSSRTSGFRTSNCTICPHQDGSKRISCFQVKRLAYFSLIACVMLCFISRKSGTVMISNDWPNLDCSDHRVMSPWNIKHQKTKCKENISQHAMQGIKRLNKHVPYKNTGGDGESSLNICTRWSQDEQNNNIPKSSHQQLYAITAHQQILAS